MHIFKNAGHEIIAIAPKDEHTQKIIDNGFQYIEVKELARKGTNPLRDLGLVLELRSIYKSAKLDAVIQYTIKPNIYGTFAAKLSGVKAICTISGLGHVFYNSGISNFIAKNLYWMAFLFSDKFFIQNEDDFNLFFKSYVSPGKKAAMIMGSGIDTQYYSPDYCADKQPKEAHFPTFIMIARLLMDKGVYEYAETAKTIKSKYPNARFLLLGDIDEDSHATINPSDLAEWKQQGYIQHLGFVKETRPFICEADAVVLPSYREGIPRVILEGLSMGKPCITTDAPGCRQTVTDGVNGFICKTADAASLTAACQKFIELNLEQRTEMGLSARNTALNTFDLKIIAEKYLFTVKEL